MKVCTKCLLAKPLSEFSSDKKSADRLQYYCHSCARVQSRDYRARNLEKCKEATRKRNAKRTKEDLNRFPDKISARRKLGRAVRMGGLIKPDLCQGCECSGKIEAHHEDYSKPLDVLWLCTGCHGYVHYMDGFKKELELKYKQENTK